MSIEKNTIKIAAADKLDFVLRAGALATMSGALVFLSPLAPVVTASAAVAYASWRRHKRKKLKPQLMYPVRDPSPDTEEFCERTAKKLGLASTPKLFITHDKGDMQGLCWGDRIYLTSKLTNGLLPDEKHAVIAHEMVHIAGEHEPQRRVLLNLENATQASAIAFAVLQGFDIVSTAMSAGSNLLGSFPRLATVGGIATSAIIGADLICQRRQIRCENNADRLSAEVTGNPQALADALTKSDPYRRPSIAKLWANTKESLVARDLTSVVLQTVFNAFYLLGSSGPLRPSHPLTATRIERLETMHRQLNP